jgi:hypothetical protein
MSQVWEAASEKLFFLINAMERYLRVQATSALFFFLMTSASFGALAGPVVKSDTGTAHAAGRITVKALVRCCLSPVMQTFEAR